MPNSVDVLVCTHNEAIHIGRVLESLEHQTVGTGGFRVIVVDNDSHDGTAELVNSYFGRLNLVHVVEQRLGLNYARNTGYSISRAEYIAHLDADAKARPDWLENIQRVLAAVQPDLCGGPYYPYYVDSKPAWFLDRYNMHYPGDTARFLSSNEYLSGTNMIWRRSLVDKLGGFRNGHGLVGRGLIRGDETELILRARAQFPEFRAYYDPDIIVYHLTRRETFSLKYWLHRSFVNAQRQEAASANHRSKLPGEDAWFFRTTLDSAQIIALAFARATIFRNRRQYSYWQNYVYERVLPAVHIITTAYERWRPRWRANR